MSRSDDDILADITSGGRRCEAALKMLYDQLRPRVFKHIQQNKGTQTEAQDVLQDAIVAVYTHIIEKKFRGQSSLTTFTFSVAKNQWLNRLKRKKIESRFVDENDRETVSEDLLPSYFQHEKRNAIEQLFSSLGSACEALLTKVFYLNYSMKDIVAESNYENEQVARNKKYKCMKRLKNLVRENAHVVELLRQ